MKMAEDLPDTVIYESDGGPVARITLNRPGKLNAITKDMHLQFMDAFRRFNADADAYIVVVKGNGRAFCAGRDITDQAATGRQPNEGTDPEVTHYATPLVEKIVITSARGPAIGAGGYMLMSGDVRVVSKSLHFNLREIPTGVLGPWWLELAENVPPPVAFKIAIGQRISVDELLQWGLVTEVVEDEDLEATTERWVQELLSLPRQHLLETKRLMSENRFRFTPEIFAKEMAVRQYLDGLADSREAALAFAEKRPARFTGK